MKQLNTNKTISLLKKFKLPFAKSKLISTPEQAVKFSEEIGYPIALKIISKDVLHKSDVKGVLLNIKNKEQAKYSYNKLIKAAKKSKIKLDGILIQKMESGKEVIVGIKRDPQFGPVIIFGLGGIFVELLKDISLRIAPIDKSQALEMIKQIKAYPILKGMRGEKSVNIEALANIIAATSKLSENKKIQELDFNPIIVNKKSAVIVDAKIIVS